MNDDHVTTFLNENIVIEMMNNDMDVDGTGIPSDSLRITQTALHGIATANQNSFTLSYEPNPGFLGIDTFYYKLCDFPVEGWDSTLARTCGEAMVTVNVVPTNLSIQELNTIQFVASLKEDELVIQTSSEFEGNVSIYSLNGQLILKQAYSQAIPFKFPNGMYIVVLESANEVGSTKLVKAN